MHSCRKKIGPGEVNLIMMAVRRAIKASNGIAAEQIMRSTARFQRGIAIYSIPDTCYTNNESLPGGERRKYACSSSPTI
jgi:hypothetical protein